MRYYEALRQPRGTSSIEAYRCCNNEHIETVLTGIKPQAMGKKVALVLNDAFMEGHRVAYDKLYPEIERLRSDNYKYLSVIEAYKAQHESDKFEKAQLNKRIKELEDRLDYHRKSA